MSSEAARHPDARFTHRRWPLILWGIGWVVTGCGTPPSPAKPPPRSAQILKKMEEIDARLRPVEVATPVSAPAPREPALKRGNGLRLDLGAAQRVEFLGDRAQTVDLAAYVGQQRGAVFALWATWCKPCIADEELALLRQLQGRLSADFPLISMACDGLDQVWAHEKAPRWIHPLWQLDDGHIRLLPQSFMQEHGLGLPIFLIVGPDGTVQWYRTQALDAAAVAEILTAAAR